MPDRHAAPAGTPELLPCPFCGGKAKFCRRQDESLWSHAIVWWSHVYCPNCDAQRTPSCEDESGSEAIAAWNERATPAAPAGDRTSFDYLLNAFEAASQHDAPATHGYADKRRALFAYVRGLEAKVAGSLSSGETPASTRGHCNDTCSLPHRRDGRCDDCTPAAPSAPLATEPGDALLTWPIDDVLRILADAADHLLQTHDCDTHGWEQIGEAAKAARAHVAARASRTGGTTV